MRNGLGNSIFFMNHANKKEGACLYNKRLTSTLSALSKCTYRFNKPNRLMTIIISRVINLFSIFVFDIGFHVITFWVNFCDVGDATLNS